jgi:tryptophan synthase alpha chain
MSSGRIQKVFNNGHKALIAYITAGDPTPEKTPELALALVRGGVDLIELGVPFSDPIADGPVIQRGAERALKAGTNLKKVLEIAAAIRQGCGVPLVLFTYMNPVLKYGLEALAPDAKAAGIDGCLLTDLSVEEALGGSGKYTGAMKSAGLDTIFLAAPTSTPARQKLVAEYSSGFVYLVSRTGVTGERESIADSLAPLVKSMRGVTKLPLAVGFGIATPEQAREVAKTADGVVVGSAIVRLIEQGGDVEAFARSLRKGMDA